MESSLFTIVEKDKTKSYLIHQYGTKDLDPCIVRINYKNLWYECVAPLHSIETFRELREEML